VKSSSNHSTLALVGIGLAPLGVFVGWVAGAMMARRLVRHEIEEFRRLNETPEREMAVPAHKPADEVVQPLPAPVQSAPSPAAPPVEEQVSGETLSIISAVVAAVLGKRARVRGAHLMRTAPSTIWAQQGRVFVQGSHNIEVSRHGH
jgi:hypothetical protein